MNIAICSRNDCCVVHREEPLRPLPPPPPPRALEWLCHILDVAVVVHVLVTPVAAIDNGVVTRLEVWGLGRGPAWRGGMWLRLQGWWRQ